MPGIQIIQQRPSVQRRCLSCHAGSCRTRRAALSVWAAVVTLDTFDALPAQAANDAVLNQLERLKRDEISQEISTPALTRLSRIEVCPRSPSCVVMS